MNKRGQQLMMGMLILIAVVIIFVATLPAIAEIATDARGCSSLNCAGYVDTDASAAASCASGNQTYDSTLDSNTLGCTMLDLLVPFLVLGVVIGLITKFLHGQLTEAPQPAYPQY